jgi:hypothetical protein
MNDLFQRLLRSCSAGNCIAMLATLNSTEVLSAVSVLGVHVIHHSISLEKSLTLPTLGTLIAVCNVTETGD